MKYKINLLTQKKETLLDRVIYFALNYLRYILVITQIVVIIVFFIKFKIDQDIIDLKEAVSQKEEIINVSRPLLDEAKIIDKKTKEVKLIADEQDTFLASTSYIFSVFPKELFLDKLSISGAQTTLAGLSANPNAIRAFLNRLQADARYKTTTLKSIKKADDGLHFVFELNEYKK